MAGSLQELKPPCRLEGVGYILWSNLLRAILLNDGGLFPAVTSLLVRTAYALLVSTSCLCQVPNKGTYLLTYYIAT